MNPETLSAMKQAAAKMDATAGPDDYDDYLDVASPANVSATTLPPKVA